MSYFPLLIGGIVVAAGVALLPFFLLLFLGELALTHLPFGRGAKFLLMALKSLRRNLLRTSLTYLAVFILVVVVTLVWSVLWFLDNVTAEKAKDLKAVVTERWQVPSQMPFAYAAPLEAGAASRPGDVRPMDSMTWQFYGGTLDPNKRTRENILFFFAMEADKLRPMMDDLENLDEELVRKLQANKRGALVGRDRLQALNKRVGDTFTVTSMNYKGIDLEFQVVGEFPDGRYNQSAVMHRDYLNDALDAFYLKNGAKHPMTEKTLNLVWLRVPDAEAFQQVAKQVMSANLGSTAVKCETASSGISSWLDAYKDLIRGMRWFLAPAILVSMCLVVANAISISVRERRTEMAVLKVLGFRPWQVMTLVLGEAVLIGALSGLFSSGITFLVINKGLGGLKFPIAFFPSFMIPTDALWWGCVFGALTALLGSLIPSWSARTVKVSEVFSKVA